MGKRVIGLVLVAIAGIVAAHTVIEPLYHVSSETQPYSIAWQLIDPIMALGIVLAIIFSYLRKIRIASAGDHTPLTWEHLAANTLFYGILFVAILFFSNWFNILNPAFTGMGAGPASLVWTIIDASLPLLLGAMGIFLLRATD